MTDGTSKPYPPCVDLAKTWPSVFTLPCASLRLVDPCLPPIATALAPAPLPPIPPLQHDDSHRYHHGKQHETILAALQAGDADYAEAAMIDHINRSRVRTEGARLRSGTKST
jgi:hypothetical protein